MTDIKNLLFLDLETRSTVDLRKTGAYVYALDPSTSVTVARLAIGMEDPWEWRPGRELLPKYRAHLEDPTKEVVAHNAQFERLLIEGVLHPRHGWPLVAIDRWICTMARARAQALPGSLDGAGMAIGLPVKKDGDGYRLMLQMCKPRRTSDGSLAWWEDEDRMTRLSDYCSTDVKVERQIYRSTAALPQPELDVWDLTETMNDRGVRFDLSFVAAASIVAEETVKLLNHDMNLLTVGAVKTASNVGALKSWLMKRGVDLTPPPDLAREGDLLEYLEEAEPEEEATPDLRRRDVQRLLADPRVGLLEKRVLRCRLEAGKISVRKLEAIHERSNADGRVRGLLGYHGASTGRYISQGLQVQNFPRDVVADWDGHRALLDHGAAMVDAIAGPPLAVVSKMLRGAIIPAEGHEIAAGDFASVEAAGVAWLAGQHDLVEAFRQKRKIYEEMGGRVYGIDPATVTKDSKARFVGKTCLGAGTRVLTDRGPVAIEDVTTAHKLWDGIEWVRHDGLLKQGLKKTLNLSGISLTPDHRVWCGTGWREARYLAHGENNLFLKSALAAANLPSRATSRGNATGYQPSSSDVAAEGRSSLSRSTTSNILEALVAVSAAEGRAMKSAIGSMKTRCLMWLTDRACSIVWPLPSLAAIPPPAGSTPVMAAGGYSYAMSGETIVLLSSATSRPSQDGTTPASTWTEPTTTGATSPAISVSRPTLKTRSTDARSMKWKSASETLRPVYDLANAGPRHRFTILTGSDEPLIVSNCVLGCGYQMGWYKFRETCIAQASVLLTPEEAERAVGVYRRTYRQIPLLWENMNQAAIDAVRHPGQATAVAGGRIRFRMARKWLRMRLPSGRYIWYSQPLIETGRFGNDCVSYMSVNSLTKKWERQQTYGGRLVENCVQAICRDLLVHAALRLEQEGYRPLTLIHDEVVCEPPVGFGDVDSMCAIMAELPDWASGFPLRAEGSRGPRYMK
jgi:hypothetical protein